jgi:hypothetical protein
MRHLHAAWEWQQNLSSNFESTWKMGRKSIPQGLKPNSFSAICGTAEGRALSKLCL